MVSPFLLQLWSLHLDWAIVFYLLIFIQFVGCFLGAGFLSYSTKTHIECSAHPLANGGVILFLCPLGSDALQVV